MKQPDSPPIIRRARLSDIEAITEIYNEAIPTSVATFDIEPNSVPDRLEWLKSHDQKMPAPPRGDARDGSAPGFSIAPRNRRA